MNDKVKSDIIVGGSFLALFFAFPPIIAKFIYFQCHICNFQLEGFGNGMTLITSLVAGTIAAFFAAMGVYDIWRYWGNPNPVDR